MDQMTSEMEKREYFPDENIGSQNYDSDTPIYAVVDKTRNFQESPQRIQGEECKNIKEDDREDRDEREDMISLYAEVDKIKPANASPQNGQRGATKNLVLENEYDGDDLWSCQEGYSMVGKDFIHTASLQTAPVNPDPHNTTPELSIASSVNGVKFYYKHVSLREFLFIIVTLILIIIVAFTVSIAVISTKIKSIEDKIKNNVQHGSNNEKYDDHALPFLNYNQTIEMIKNLSFNINERLDSINSSTNDNSHLLLQVSDSINMHNQTLVSLEERVRNQICTVSSCADLLRIDPSGLYWIRSSSGIMVQVYCDMNRTCGNITGGWMRVADVSVGANSDSCPGELYQIGSSNHYACKIETPNSASSSLFFSTHNTRYSHICGEVTAYQMGSLKAFNRLNVVDTNRNSDELTIDMSYVDGISITHGCPRKHIWTFAAAHTRQGQSSCPCNGGHQPPSFVGNDYTCDLGCNSCNIDNNDYYRLWEGSSCDFYQPCCSNSRVPFFKLLSQPTTDYIELRVMREVNNMNEDILIDNINILVQ